MDESSLGANYFNYFLTQSPGLSAAAHSTAWQLPAPYVPFQSSSLPKAASAPEPLLWDQRGHAGVDGWW